MWINTFLEKTKLCLCGKVRLCDRTVPAYIARGNKSWEQLHCCRGFYHTVQNGSCSYKNTILQDMTSLEKKSFCCKVMTKIRAEHLFEKISFANALLEFYITAREGEKVPCTSTSYLPWLSGRVGMFYLLSAEQAWLHFLQAALTAVRTAFESRSPELLFRYAGQQFANNPQALILGVH